MTQIEQIKAEIERLDDNWNGFKEGTLFQADLRELLSFIENLEKEHPHTNESMKVVLEKTYPELVESEDEKIRKALLRCCDDWEKGQFGCMAKEDVPAIRTYLEKQKEQKPAECLKPERDCWYVCIKDFYGGGKKQSSNGDLVQAKGGMYMMVREDISEWFRKAYYDEVKPAEWSEEDRQHISWILECLADGSRTMPEYKNDFRAAYNWLKSLRPQPKQERQIKEGNKVRIHCRKDRPKHIITIYDGKVGEVINVWDAKRNPWGHIGVRLDNGCNNGFHEDELEILDEPHWKPSEVQMAVLSWFCNGVVDGVCAPDLQEKLKSLYKDLKKL